MPRKTDPNLFRLVTTDIEEVYKKVSSSHPEYLHPNLKEIILRPSCGNETSTPKMHQMYLITAQTPMRSPP